MELKHIGMVNTIQAAAVNDGKARKEKAAADERKDALQLSGQVKDLLQTRLNARIELMKARVESGYYFSDEVTEKTAEKLLRAL